MTRSLIYNAIFLLFILYKVSGQALQCPNQNEEYACGSACQIECSTLGEPCPIVNIKCNDACYCKEGYARNKNGTCIPIKECNQS